MFPIPGFRKAAFWGNNYIESWVSNTDGDMGLCEGCNIGYTMQREAVPHLQLLA